MRQLRPSNGVGSRGREVVNLDVGRIGRPHGAERNPVASGSDPALELITVKLHDVEPVRTLKSHDRLGAHDCSRSSDERKSPTFNNEKPGVLPNTGFTLNVLRTIRRQSTLTDFIR